MAIHRLAESALTGEAFPLFGDGSAVRDFTYVADVVDANLRAGGTDVPGGTVVNVAGGSSTTVRELVELVAEVTGSEVPIEEHPPQPGDVARTGATIDRAAELLGWSPGVGLREGITEQVAWHRHRRSP